MVEEPQIQSQQTPSYPDSGQTPLTPPPQQPRFKRPSRKPVLIIAGIVLFLLLVATGLYIFVFKSEPAQIQDTSQETTEEESIQQVTFRDDPATVHMLATGDFIAHDAINAEAKTADGYDYTKMLAPFKKIFADYTVNFCNQATPAGGVEFGITGYPVFNAPLEWIHGLKGAGCNVINVGTNHTNDKGQKPVTAMLNEWDKQDVLAVAGANRSTQEQQTVRYFDSKGVKFAFLSYSTYTNLGNPNPYTLNMYNDSLVNAQMAEAKEKADVIIVSMRWGTEYSEEVNAAQKAQAKKLADLGADIILGHGTHTLQPVEIVTAADGNEATVWYGLGNFLNAQLETTGLTGCVAQFDIDTATQKVTSTSCLPFYQHYEWTAEEKAAEKLLARKNFLIMPLYEAQDYMAKSQMGSSVEEQMGRIETLVNTYTKVSVQNGRDL